MLNHIVKAVAAAVREHVVKRFSRSPQWSKLRKNFLRENPKCKACGSTVSLQVHHVRPFHIDPALELDHTNLITLCMSKNECHIRIGHGDNYKAFNPLVREHCAFLQIHPATFETIAIKAKEMRQLL